MVVLAGQRSVSQGFDNDGKDFLARFLGDSPAQPGDELSEEQVETVAAGLCCVHGCLTHIHLCI